MGFSDLNTGFGCGNIVCALQIRCDAGIQINHINRNTTVIIIYQDADFPCNGSAG